ncbi:methylated-DNA--[protein]-cysteine S-methyltransferase [Paenibacillus sp. GCM10027627]|uniref:methylated-DNA--[protein]-cysteine S-methyltransferase n=1 Tax=unclassified Paenibacillus TaxID=185978 RepID=UPI00362DCE9F
MKSKIKPKTTIYWTIIELWDWVLPIAATEDGLCGVGSNGDSIELLKQRMAPRFPDADWIRDDEGMSIYSKPISAFLNRECPSFDFPHDVGGTPFQRSVWEALLAIPYGATVTYSEIANAIGKPAAVRAVGKAIGANPALITVPCHRVIGKNGALTGYRGGLAMKTKLLELEQA